MSELWHIALSALRTNWFRSFLTALGIVIGVGSLVAVGAVSTGAQREVTDSIRRLGANVVLVDGEFITVGAVQTPSDRTLTPDDASAIAKLPAVTAVARVQDIESLTISAGRNKTTTHLFGITPVYESIYNLTSGAGRLISPTDVAFGRSVVVLGQTPRRRLFPGADPVGSIVRIGNHPFEVVGVQSRKGRLGGDNLDNRIYVPLPLITQVLLGGANTKSIGVRVRSETEIEPTMDEIGGLLRRQHKLPPSFADDFSIEDQASIVKEAQSATSTFRILTFVLGGIALLVGGIGIMNMMLVSVHERTREIGIRKSVGADPWNIQIQFLIEAFVLTTFGATVGLIGGIATSRIISSLAGWHTLVTPTSLIVSFLVALAVGLFFGYYPARRAARLDPITALRYE